MRKILLLSLGLLALLPTLALIGGSVVLAIQISDHTMVRDTAVCVATLESMVWISLAFLTTATTYTSLSSFIQHSSLKKKAMYFGSATLLCVVAAAIGTMSLVFLSGVDDKKPRRVTDMPFLIAASVILATAAIAQLAFLGTYYLCCRRNQSRDEGELVRTNETSRPKFYVRSPKSIPYERTRPSMAENREVGSTDSVDLASLPSKRLRIQVNASPRSSMSQTLRTETSRSRLIPPKGKQHHQQRPASLDSGSYTPSLDGNDNWDATSGHGRSADQDAPSPTTLLKPRLLETIPASPIVAETPNVDGSVLDLEPPPPITRQSSRSYSPVPPKRTPSRQGSSSPSPSIAAAEESNVHPLFRSDSPTPPPVATPGTIVLASPDAGKVITQRPSNQSLRRLRSGSAASSSPLSRRGSFEAPSLARGVTADENSSVMKMRLEEEEDGDDTETETELAPPIPEFVMGAGSRSSLTRYASNKKETDGSP